MKTNFLEILNFVRKYGANKVLNELLLAEQEGRFIPELQPKIDLIFRLLESDNQSDLDRAQNLINELKNEYWNMPALIKAQAYLEALKD